MQQDNDLSTTKSTSKQPPKNQYNLCMKIIQSIKIKAIGEEGVGQNSSVKHLMAVFSYEAGTSWI